MKPRLLDLYCKAGGSAKGYYDAGFEVVGVDKDWQPNYPFGFIQADALDFLRVLVDGCWRCELRGQLAYHPAAPGASVWEDCPVCWGWTLALFDAIHASAPCQWATPYQRRPDHVRPCENLIPQTRELLEQTGLPWIIENVEQARSELREPVMLCGSSFGLDVRRHRLFESSFPLIVPPCDHSWQTPRFPAATNRRPNSRCTVEIGVWRIPLDVQQRAMGIDWMTLDELSEAIPPVFTELIGHQLMQHVARPALSEAGREVEGR